VLGYDCQRAKASLLSASLFENQCRPDDGFRPSSIIIHIVPEMICSNATHASYRFTRAFPQKLWPLVGYLVAFYLILTFSRWEKEQPLAGFLKCEKLGKPLTTVALPENEKCFSLS
jgi:hypothetical protein